MTRQPETEPGTTESAEKYAFLAGLAGRPYPLDNHPFDGIFNGHHDSGHTADDGCVTVCKTFAVARNDLPLLTCIIETSTEPKSIVSYEDATGDFSRMQTMWSVNRSVTWKLHTHPQEHTSPDGYVGYEDMLPIALNYATKVEAEAAIEFSAQKLWTMDWAVLMTEPAMNALSNLELLNDFPDSAGPMVSMLGRMSPGLFFTH